MLSLEYSSDLLRELNLEVGLILTIFAVWSCLCKCISCSWVMLSKSESRQGVKLPQRSDSINTSEYIRGNTYVEGNGSFSGFMP